MKEYTITDVKEQVMPVGLNHWVCHFCDISGLGTGWPAGHVDTPLHRASARFWERWTKAAHRFEEKRGVEFTKLKEKFK